MGGTLPKERGTDCPSTQLLYCGTGLTQAHQKGDY
jgi:hypothetical protein